MEEIDKYKEVLKLAGKLANQVQFLLQCDMSVLPIALEGLGFALDEYNNYIINWSKNNGN